MYYSMSHRLRGEQGGVASTLACSRWSIHESPVCCAAQYAGYRTMHYVLPGIYTTLTRIGPGYQPTLGNGNPARLLT